MKKTFRTATSEDKIQILYILGTDMVVFEDVIAPNNKHIINSCPDKIAINGKFVSTTDPHEHRTGRSVLVNAKDFDYAVSEDDYYIVLVNPTKKDIENAKLKVSARVFKENNCAWRLGIYFSI